MSTLDKIYYIFIFTFDLKKLVLKLGFTLMDEKNKISPQYKINMSFNLCQKSDRGSLTDLSAKGAGIDQKIISDANDGFSYLDQQHDGQFNNFVQDTSVRTCMEGKRNVFSANIKFCKSR